MTKPKSPEGFSMKEILIEVREAQKAMTSKLDRVEEQTTKTNGRVTAMEPIVNAHTKKLERLGLKIATWSGAISVIIFVINFYV